MTSLRTPAQQTTLDTFGSDRSDLPEFDPELGHHLRTAIETELADVAPGLDPDDALWVSKHSLSQVHGCEARYLAEEASPFEPSVATVRGAVAHKAIELSFSRRVSLDPLDLVDEALAYLQESELWLARFLRTCTELEWAEIRSGTNDRVVKFLELWPPLEARWRPVIESSRRIDDLFGGRLVLSGKVDLVLGRSTGTRAGKVLIDLKTGTFSADHQHDLRFYALIETIREGVPPRLVGTHYLDSNEKRPEAVTEEVLWAALARTVDGVRTMVAMMAGDRDPTKKPGPPCRWCPANDDCAEGRVYLEEREALTV